MSMMPIFNNFFHSGDELFVVKFEPPTRQVGFGQMDKEKLEGWLQTIVDKKTGMIGRIVYEIYRSMVCSSRRQLK